MNRTILPIPATKPVRMPAAAAGSLPRWALAVLCFVYILPGLFGRDPWKNADVADFGTMWTMAHGTWADWLWPNVMGAVTDMTGPLAFWLGAVFIKLFGWAVGDVAAARLSTVCFFLIGAYSIWRTGYLLGQRADTQPMRLVFGGQPAVEAYGRVLADASLLIYLGCLGLLRLTHETTVEALYVSCVAYVLYRCVRYVNLPNIKNAVLLGIAMTALAFTDTVLAPGALYVFLFAGLCFSRNPVVRHIINILIALAVTVAFVVLWYFVLESMQPYGANPFSMWMARGAMQLNWPDAHSLGYFFKTSLWFFWPAWPYAVWSIYAWRKQWRGAHVILPLIFTAVFTVIAIFSPASTETVFLALCPPIAVLGALAIPTLRRGAIHAVDWFSVMTLTLAAGFIWLAWIAHTTGWPKWLWKNATKLTPGFEPGFNVLALVAGIAVTLVWAAIVYWRIIKHPKVLWRGVILSTAGVMLCWSLLGTLCLPWANYQKSYKQLSEQMSAQITDKHACVKTYVPLAQRASFAYFGGIRLDHFAKKETCSYLLLRDHIPKHHRKKVKQPPQTFAGMNLVWSGNRAGDKNERFRLYKAP